MVRYSAKSSIVLIGQKVLTHQSLVNTFRVYLQLNSSHIVIFAYYFTQQWQVTSFVAFMIYEYEHCSLP
jgi:hypothetical protein